MVPHISPPARAGSSRLTRLAAALAVVVAATALSTLPTNRVAGLAVPAEGTAEVYD